MDFAKVADFVADAGGLLVAFGGDGLIEFGTEFFETLMENLHGHETSRNLADVRSSLVHAADHLADFLGKRGVTITAPETANTAEVIKCESAGRALAAAA
jgi:hypothetical protein